MKYHVTYLGKVIISCHSKWMRDEILSKLHSSFWSDGFKYNAKDTK